ncbi:MAG: hypothetical protein AAF664_12355, partial [Planctomycetota bacterium]
MKATILEPYSAGHRLHFVRLVAEAFVEMGAEVTLATLNETLESQESNTYLRDILDELDIHVLTETKKNVGNDPSRSNGIASKQTAWFQDVLKRKPAEKLLIPTASQFQPFLLRSAIRWRSWAKETSVEALFLGPGFGYSFGSLKRKVGNAIQLNVASRLPVDRYFHLDSQQLEEVQRHSRRPDSHYVVMPDPAPQSKPIDPHKARQRLKLPMQGHYSLLAGAISKSKGAIKILESLLCLSDQTAKDLRVL